MTLDKGAVRAIAAALPLVVPGHLTPFLTQELQEHAGAKILAELERKGWLVLSAVNVAQLEHKALTVHAADGNASELVTLLGETLGQVREASECADRVLATLRGVR